MKASRRKFITTSGAAAGALMTFGIPRHARSQVLAPTPRCSDGHEATPRQTAGPYFKPNSPQRSLLMEPSDAATQLRLSGQVVTASCKPIAQALLDFWHADADGLYDRKGFRHRGHLFSDAEGRFDLQTILPGLYGGRTRHIHVRAQPAGGAILTTQLYFPGEPANQADFLFNPALLLKLVPNTSPLEATFDFVLEA
ncbi:MAG: twin-arginine translocation signal domain-containing protein [Rhodomicrobium sp.]